MIVEQRTYTLSPGALPRFLAAYESHGLAAHRDVYERLIGYYVSETGHLNQVVQLWAFDSFEDRGQRRERLQRDPRWLQYLEQVQGLLTQQESRLLKPMAWSPAAGKLSDASLSAPAPGAALPGADSVHSLKANMP